MAQVAEHILGKDEVTSSNLVSSSINGVDGDEVPPVPFPNTVVKLICVYDTWLDTAWKNRWTPFYCCFLVKVIAIS